MGYASTTVAFNAPANKVWETLADFGGILKWAPAGEGAEITNEGDGIGMIRHLTLPPYGTAGERLDALDNNAMVLVLTMAYNPPMGASRYQARISVKSTGDDSCTSSWEGFFDVPEGVDEAEAEENFRTAYGAMYDGLKGYVEG